MHLKKGLKKDPRPEPVSVRVSVKARQALDDLTEWLGLTQADVLIQLLEAEHAYQKKKLKKP